MTRKGSVPFVWDNAAITRLRDLAANSASASEMARIMGGGLSRSAILGKCRRENIRLQNGSGPAKPKEARPPKAVAAAKPAAPAKAEPAPRRLQPLSMVEQRVASPDRAAELAANYLGSGARRRAFDATFAPEGARIVSLAELEAGQCKWPLYDDGPMVFCGCMVTIFDRHGQPASYCDHHQTMSLERRS